MKGILDKLGITQKELREICVISGTDYNSLNDDSKNTHTLYTTLKYFKKYHKEKTSIGFYDWLIENTDYVKNSENLKNIYNIFDLNTCHININVFENIKIVNGPIIKETIKTILKSDGFLFSEKS
jgi:hypothetical protein